MSHSLVLIVVKRTKQYSKYKILLEKIENNEYTNDNIIFSDYKECKELDIKHIIEINNNMIDVNEKLGGLITDTYEDENTNYNSLLSLYNDISELK